MMNRQQLEDLLSKSRGVQGAAQVMDRQRALPTAPVPTPIASRPAGPNAITSNPAVGEVLGKLIGARLKAQQAKAPSIPEPTFAAATPGTPVATAAAGSGRAATGPAVRSSQDRPEWGSPPAGSMYTQAQWDELPPDVQQTLFLAETDRINRETAATQESVVAPPTGPITSTNQMAASDGGPEQKMRAMLQMARLGGVGEGRPGVVHNNITRAPDGIDPGQWNRLTPEQQLDAEPNPPGTDYVWWNSRTPAFREEYIEGEKEKLADKERIRNEQTERNRIAQMDRGHESINQHQEQLARQRGEAAQAEVATKSPEAMAEAERLYPNPPPDMADPYGYVGEAWDGYTLAERAKYFTAERPVVKENVLPTPGEAAGAVKDYAVDAGQYAVQQATDIGTGARSGVASIGEDPVGFAGDVVDVVPTVVSAFRGDPESMVEVTGWLKEGGKEVLGRIVQAPGVGDFLAATDMPRGWNAAEVGQNMYYAATHSGSGRDDFLVDSEMVRWVRDNPEQWAAIEGIHANGYKGFEGDRAVWEWWIGQQPVWKRGLYDVVMDPFNWASVGGGVKAGLLRQADDMATKAALTDDAVLARQARVLNGIANATGVPQAVVDVTADLPFTAAGWGAKQVVRGVDGASAAASGGRVKPSALAEDSDRTKLDQEIRQTGDMADAVQRDIESIPRDDSRRRPPNEWGGGPTGSSGGPRTSPTEPAPPAPSGATLDPQPTGPFEPSGGLWFPERIDSLPAEDQIPARREWDARTQRARVIIDRGEDVPGNAIFRDPAMREAYEYERQRIIRRAEVEAAAPTTRKPSPLNEEPPPLTDADVEARANRVRTDLPNEPVRPTDGNVQPRLAPSRVDAPNDPTRRVPISDSDTVVRSADDLAELLKSTPDLQTLAIQTGRNNTKGIWQTTSVEDGEFLERWGISGADPAESDRVRQILGLSEYNRVNGVDVPRPSGGLVPEPNGQTSFIPDDERPAPSSLTSQVQQEERPRPPGPGQLALGQNVRRDAPPRPKAFEGTAEGPVVHDPPAPRKKPRVRNAEPDLDAPPTEPPARTPADDYLDNDPYPEVGKVSTAKQRWWLRQLNKDDQAHIAADMERTPQNRDEAKDAYAVRLERARSGVRDDQADILANMREDEMPSGSIASERQAIGQDDRPAADAIKRDAAKLTQLTPEESAARADADAPAVEVPKRKPGESIKVGPGGRPAREAKAKPKTKFTRIKVDPRFRSDERVVDGAKGKRDPIVVDANGNAVDESTKEYREAAGSDPKKWSTYTVRQSSQLTKRRKTRELYAKSSPDDVGKPYVMGSEDLGYHDPAHQGIGFNGQEPRDMLTDPTVPEYVSFELSVGNPKKAWAFYDRFSPESRRVRQARDARRPAEEALRAKNASPVKVTAAQTIDEVRLQLKAYRFMREEFGLRSDAYGRPPTMRRDLDENDVHSLIDHAIFGTDDVVANGVRTQGTASKAADLLYDQKGTIPFAKHGADRGTYRPEDYVDMPWPKVADNLRRWREELFGAESLSKQQDTARRRGDVLVDNPDRELVDLSDGKVLRGSVGPDDVVAPDLIPRSELAPNVRVANVSEVGGQVPAGGIDIRRPRVGVDIETLDPEDAGYFAMPRRYKKAAEHESYIRERIDRDPGYRTAIRELEGKELFDAVDPATSHGTILAKVSDELNYSGRTDRKTLYDIVVDDSLRLVKGYPMAEYLGEKTRSAALKASRELNERTGRVIVTPLPTKAIEPPPPGVLSGKLDQAYEGGFVDKKIYDTLRETHDIGGLKVSFWDMYTQKLEAGVTQRLALDETRAAFESSAIERYNPKKFAKDQERKAAKKVDEMAGTRRKAKEPIFDEGNDPYQNALNFIRAGMQFNIVKGPPAAIMDMTGNLLNSLTMGKFVNPIAHLKRTKTIYKYGDDVEAMMPGLAGYEAYRATGSTPPRSLNPDMGREQVSRSDRLIHTKIGDRYKVLKPVMGALASERIKNFRGASDVAARFSVFLDEWTKQMPKARLEFVKLAETKVDVFGPDLLPALAELPYYFSTSDLKDKLSAIAPPGVKDESLARAWTNQLSKAKETAEAEQIRLYFSYRQKNADAFLGKAFLFHYWQSRAVVLHTKNALHHPGLLNAYVGLWEEAREGAERDNLPTWAQTFVKLPFVGEAFGGFQHFVDPISLVVPFAALAELGNPGSFASDSPLEKVLNGSGLFLNPLIESVFAGMGWVHGAPDPLATRSVRNGLISTIDLLRNSDLPGVRELVGPGFTDDIYENGVNWIFSQSQRLASDRIPTANEVPIPDSTNRKVDVARSVLVDNMVEEFGVVQDWTDEQFAEWTYANTALLMGTDDNAWANDAMTEYAQQEGKRAALGMVATTAMDYSGTEKRYQEIDAAYDRDPTDTSERTPEQKSADMEGDLLEPKNPTSANTETAQTRFQNIGDDRQRSLNSGYNKIWMGDWRAGSVTTIGGQEYTGREVEAMSSDARGELAMQWLEDNDGVAEYQAYKQERDAFKASDNELIDLDAYRDDIRNTYGEDGEANARADYRDNGTRFKEAEAEQKAYIVERGMTPSLKAMLLATDTYHGEDIFRMEREGLDVEAVEMELDRWLTSIAGYEAWRGTDADSRDPVPSGGVAYAEGANPTHQNAEAKDKEKSAKDKEKSAKEKKKDDPLARYRSMPYTSRKPSPLSSYYGGR